MSLIERIDDAIKTDTAFFSMEFFPPKTPEGFQTLAARITRLSKLEPMFINVTWRSYEDRQRTLELCDYVQNKVGIEVMMHLACRDLVKTQVQRVLESAKRSGVRNLLVIAGDRANKPAAQDGSKAAAGDFPHAIDLVRFIRAKYGNFFGIAVAGFPEGNPHPTDGGQAKESAEQYFQHLAAKVNAGADLIITQAFFDDTKYTSFVERCLSEGIDVPILAGVIAPPSNAFLQRVISHFSIGLPGTMSTKLRMVAHRPMDFKHYITNYVVNMSRMLRRQHVPGLHFFTMNVESLVHNILTKLGFQETVASRRKLPWRSTGRRNEDVRPIFWSNRQQSYLARTRSWNKLPTGRWTINGALSLNEGSSGGDREGGDVKRFQSKRTSTERRIYWGNALAFPDDISDIFARYLQGQVPFLPWCEEELNAETVTIRSDLVKINRQGFWTINSQPRVCGVPSTDPTFGWGTPGGYVYQKAYVEFFCSPQNLQLLMKAVQQNRNSTMTYVASDVQGNMYTNSKFRGPNAVTWGVFVNDEVLQPTVVDHESFMVWKGEAFSLWDLWAEIYEPDGRSFALINSIHDTYFLVSLVDNDFVKGNIYKVFETIQQLKSPQIAAAQFAAQQFTFSSHEFGLDAEARFRAASTAAAATRAKAPSRFHRSAYDAPV